MGECLVDVAAAVVVLVTGRLKLRHHRSRGAPRKTSQDAANPTTNHAAAAAAANEPTKFDRASSLHQESAFRATAKLRSNSPKLYTKYGEPRFMTL